MLFQQAIVGNSRVAAEQWNEVRAYRDAYNRHEMAVAANGVGMPMIGHNGGPALVGNEGIIPQDVFQEFDNITVERFRSDDGDVFLNDLLPLSRSVSIGKLTYKFRRASDAGLAQTSMSGQQGVLMDQVEYTYDGTIVPVHDTGFGRNWREWSAQQSEGFDALIDDQRECVATLRRLYADRFLDGHKDKDGNTIVVDGLSWAGMRNDSRVAQVNIGAAGINFDFTDQTKTGDEIKNAFIQVRDVLWITNNCSKDAVYYISREMAANFERKFSTQYDARTIQQELQNLMGVDAIKVTSKLTGNEFMAFPLDGMSVRPIVGMGINTVAMPRPVFNSNYNFVVWGAAGFMVYNDFAGRKCALFAQDLG